MRVTHVITRLIVGGAQENTVYSIQGLREKPGLDVDLISGRTSGPEGSLESAFAGCPDILTIVPELVRPVRPLTDLLAVRRLVRIFRFTQPDIIHTHSGKAGVVGRIAAGRSRVPIVVHTIHGPSFGTFQGRLSNAVFRAAERHAAKYTTHFVSVADAMTRQYIAAGIGKTSDYTRIYSGFHLGPFLSSRNDMQLRAKLGFLPSDIVIGKIARLSELKGHDDLLAVAPKLAQANPHIKFLWVGDGPFRTRLQHSINQLGLAGKFVFSGLVSPVSVPPLIGIMDILVHLSRREGLPRALAQACAVGRPVVAFDCDGANEVCIENRTGFLVRVGDLKLLTSRILQLANDEGLRCRLGAAGREYVRERFAVSTMVDELYALYSRLRAQSSLHRCVG